MIVKINVDPQWIASDQMFAMHLTEWLESNKPCTICGGNGFVSGKVLNHRDDPPDDVGCHICRGEKWENPLL